MTSTTPQNVESYLSARDALIKQDRSLRRDHTRGPLTPDEAAADQFVRKLRAQEAATVWAAEHDEIPHPFPGMEFLTGKSIVEKTRLFQLLKKMPKGALLHCHLDATVEARLLLKLALEQPAMHVKTTAVLNGSTIGTVEPEFCPLHGADVPPRDAGTLCAGSYVPGGWVQIVKARETFDKSLGGPEGFDRWVISALTLNPAEAYGTHNTVNKIWTKFSQTFIVANGIIQYVPIFTKYIKLSLLASIEDGISYVEPRINFFGKYMRGLDGKQNVDHVEWVRIFDTVVKEVKAELESAGRGDDFIGARIIYSTLKRVPPEEMGWYTEDCIALKQQFPDLIAGFDLVGPENISIPLISYVQTLLDFKAKVETLGLELPLILHAGETLGDGDIPDSNVYDAVLLGTKRIGHGFSLVKHPELLKICKERDILIEVCPISNEILRLTSSMPMHPLPVLLNQGIPVALCSDDPNQFGSMGLSYDFYQVIASSEITGLIMLGEMARDSLKYSRLLHADKAKAMEVWERRWAAYVKDLATMTV